MNFSEWIRHMRLERKMDIKTFAEFVGIDNGNLSRIENARTEIMLITTARICDRLGVPPSLLLEMLYDKPMPHLQLISSSGKNIIPTMSDISVFLHALSSDWRAGYTFLTDLLNTLPPAVISFEEKVNQREGHLFAPPDMEKYLQRSRLYHFEFQYPFNLTPSHIWAIYRYGGVLQEADVSTYLRQTRLESHMSLEQLQMKVKVSDSTLSRFENGAVERVKLADAMRLDEQLEQDGKVVLLYLQVCHYNEILTHLVEHNKEQPQATSFFLPDEKVKLVRLFTSICRWFLQIHEPEDRWINDLREKLAQSTSGKITETTKEISHRAIASS